MSLKNLYYAFRPFIPRRIQICLRRQLICRKKKRSEQIWPIDKRAGDPPKNWPGWPDNKKFALVLIHDVDYQQGHDKCLQLAHLEEGLGFHSSFNFVPERYAVSQTLRKDLAIKGFEIGVHGLTHDGRLFSSRELFNKRAIKINQYLQEWDSKGFSSPSMHHKLDWMPAFNINHATSTFDTDPFEPQPDSARTIFPFCAPRNSSSRKYIELPYTLPQDFTLFILMQERNINIWKKKLDWVAKMGGMALLNTHPDYMSFNGTKPSFEEYPAEYYKEFLEYVAKEYEGRYWHALPRDVSKFWNTEMTNNTSAS